MTRINKIEKKRLPDMNILSMRRTINFAEDYSSFMGEAINKIVELIRDEEGYPSSGPIVYFHNINLEKLDVEIGFQVAEPIAGRDKIKYSTLPKRTVVGTIDQGPYIEQDSTLHDLMEWIDENNYQTVGGIYYHYLNDDDRPEKDFLTEMYVQISE
ncbi:GyrI-like domain-containing protein [Enterococcus faecium]|nr:GyrI-like domain-containing protein [Enterococcus faecium]